VVEMSTGQLLQDVKLSLEGRRPTEFYSRVGGNVPSAEEVLAFVRGVANRSRPMVVRHSEEVLHG
jgi:hypothetical protein